MSNYFGMIPSGVWGLKDLSDNAKVTYALILGLANQFGYCYATNKYLSELRGLSVSGIQKHLSQLKEFGCIDMEFNVRNDRRIIPIISPLPYEKHAQKSKNSAYMDYDNTATDQALDDLWKKIK